MSDIVFPDDSGRKPRIRVPAGSTRTKQSVVDYERARGRLTQDTFQNFSLNLGLGTNNALSDSTYGFLPITRDRTLLEWIYRGSWIAGVAIDSVAEDMTREGINITSTMSPVEMDELQAGANHFGIWSSISDTISWGRLYGGAIGVIMIEGQDPRTQLRIESVGPNQFKGIMVFDRWMVEPDLERMVRGPGDDSLVPASYWVVASGSGVSFEGMRVHHSRCFRHEGVRLPYWQRVMENMWGISVLERLYDRLIAFDSATNGAAQLVYKSYLRTFAVEKLREVVAGGGAQFSNLERYLEYMRRFQGIEGITLIDSRDKFEGQSSAGTSFGGIADALIHFGQQISGALQVPLVRLFGQSPAGLNSTGESDFRNYYDGIHQRQERELRPAVSKIYRVMARSMRINLPPDWNFDFPPLWQLQNSEKAQIATQVVGAVQAALEAGLISQKIAMKELKQSSEVTGIFSNITEEDIDGADDQITPPQPEGAGMPGMPGMEGAGAPGMEGEPGAQEQPEGPAQLGQAEQPAQQLQAANNLTAQGGQQPVESPDSGAASTPSRSQILGSVPLAAGGRGPSPIGLGSDPRNQISAGGGPGGLGSPVNTSVPPEERARAFRIYKKQDAGRFSSAASSRLRDFQGIPVYVETRKGEHRRPEWPALPADYGYIRMTGSEEGLGEGLDVFLGPDHTSDCVVVIDQIDPKTKKFDENKCLLGFSDVGSALRCYADAYDQALSRIGGVHVTDIVKFKAMLDGTWRGKAGTGAVK